VSEISGKKGTRVGIIGLGLMGAAIASNLLAKGYQVHAYNRSRDKTRPIREKGAIIHESASDLASAVEIVITSLTDENAVNAVAFGPDGFVSRLDQNGVWVEMSTIDPDASVAISEKARQLGRQKMDVPIVGGPMLEVDGKVMLLVGGSRELFLKYEPFLSEIGRPVMYLGPDGTGNRMKLVINLYLGLNAEAFSEVFVLSEKLGFAPDAFVNVLNNTPHRNYVSQIKGVKVATGDFTAQFSMSNLLKDLRLAKRQEKIAHAVLPASDLVIDRYEMAVRHGDGAKDFIAIALEIERLNGVFRPHKE
jgi:3-hydroxyisobutyrate dehydrogenase